MSNVAFKAIILLLIFCLYNLSFVGFWFMVTLRFMYDILYLQQSILSWYAFIFKYILKELYFYSSLHTLFLMSYFRSFCFVYHSISKLKKKKKPMPSIGDQTPS